MRSDYEVEGNKFVYDQTVRGNLKNSINYSVDEVEKLAESLGGDTAFNWVHPNNDSIIAFLKKLGYSVLNLIEVRKPWKNETPFQKITVGKHDFDY